MKYDNLKNVNKPNSVLETLRLYNEDNIRKACACAQNMLQEIINVSKTIDSGLMSLRTLEKINNNKAFIRKQSTSARKAHRYINSSVVSYMNQLVPYLKPTDGYSCWEHALTPEVQARLFHSVRRGLSVRNIYYLEERLIKAGVLMKTKDGKRLLDINRYEEIVMFDN